MTRINMGLGTSNLLLCKKRWRWLFVIPDVCGLNNGVSTLPPSKSARPDLKWKEMNIQHLSEEVFFPGKPDWSLLSITLYDIKLTTHPVFKWLRNMYNPATGTMSTPKETFIRECRLDLYDGCGNPIEQWIYEDVWPQQMNFNDLDMGANDFVVCNLMLRFARAYINE
jgi:hypothetical protein